MCPSVVSCTDDDFDQMARPRIELQGGQRSSQLHYPLCGLQCTFSYSLNGALCDIHANHSTPPVQLLRHKNRISILVGVPGTLL